MNVFTRKAAFLLCLFLAVLLEIGCYESQGGNSEIGTKVGLSCDIGTLLEPDDYANLASTFYALNEPSTDCEMDGITSPCLAQITPSSRTSADSPATIDVLCSCRCAGIVAEDTGPFCECPDETVCGYVFPQNDHVPSYLPGSYCIPDCLDDGSCVGSFQQ